MSKFDLIVFGLLAISAVVGFFRGAARELAAMVALLAAAALAIVGLPFSAPAAGRLIHTPWLAAVAALVGVFVIVYLVLRLIGAGVARRIHETDLLGVLDRTIGLLIGLIRGLVVLGALNLMFTAITPFDLRPHWIVESRTWPLAQDMGLALKAIAPKGLDLAGRVKPAFERAVGDSSRDRTTTDGYDAPRRGGPDDLEENSR